MRTKGQGLVEVSLVMPIIMLVMLAFADIGPFVFNFFTAKLMSARAARAASIYLPDPTNRTCLNDATNAAGDTSIIRATWNLTMSANCDNSPLSTIPRRDEVRADIHIEYWPLFWGQGPWEVTPYTIDQHR